MNSFTTSRGVFIPAATMAEVCHRLFNDEDWQLIAHEELRELIPVGEDDLSEVNEVLAEAETRLEDSRERVDEP